MITQLKVETGKTGSVHTTDNNNLVFDIWPAGVLVSVDLGRIVTASVAAVTSPDFNMPEQGNPQRNFLTSGKRIVTIVFELEE